MCVHVLGAAQAPKRTSGLFALSRHCLAGQEQMTFTLPCIPKANRQFLDPKALGAALCNPGF